MTKYILRRNWFVEGHRYRRQPGGVEIPKHLEDRLPSTAVKVGKDGKPEDKTVGDEPTTLSQLASTVNPPYDPGVKGGLQLSKTNYGAMSDEELKDLAKERDIKGRSNMNRAQLIEALEK